jgi:acyl-homoserine lactone synthase
MNSMFLERKRVFIDIMGWNLVHKDGVEVDQFDDKSAIYVIIVDDDSGLHLASARLLSTEQPHLLDMLFADLCDVDIPRGPDVRELTRFCVSPQGNARQRLELRNQLFTALVEYALVHDIRGYTGVTHASFLSQVLSIGWHCDMLGLPRETPGGTLGAVHAHVGPETIGLMRRADTFASLPVLPRSGVSIAA